MNPPRQLRYLPTFLGRNVMPKVETVDATPEFLMGLYEGHTDIQGEMLGRAFIGKWIKVSGPFGNVRPPVGAESRRTSQVTFAYDSQYNDINMVFMRFNEDWFGRLEVIPLKKNISVLGQIIEFVRNSLELGNCELVDSKDG